MARSLPQKNSVNTKWRTLLLCVFALTYRLNRLAHLKSSVPPETCSNYSRPRRLHFIMHRIIDQKPQIDTKQIIGNSLGQDSSLHLPIQDNIDTKQIIGTSPVQGSSQHPPIQDNSVAIIFATAALIYAIAKLFEVMAKGFAELIKALSKLIKMLMASRNKTLP